MTPLSGLLSRARQWDELADKSYLRSVDDLRICEVAHFYRVPPSWVRARMSWHEIGMVQEYSQIKADRDSQQMPDMPGSSGADDAPRTPSKPSSSSDQDENREAWEEYMDERVRGRGE